MAVRLRAWTLADAPVLAELINNKKVQDNLRDGIPFPYGEEDAKVFLSAMLASDPDQNIAFAIGIKLICLILGALGIANMWLAIFADVGVMILAVLNAIRALFVKKL